MQPTDTATPEQILEKVLKLHVDGTEFIDECSRCGCKIKLVQEGSISGNPNDISACGCLILQHSNSLDVQGQTITAGTNRLIYDEELALWQQKRIEQLERICAEDFQSLPRNIRIRDAQQALQNPIPFPLSND